MIVEHAESRSTTADLASTIRALTVVQIIMALLAAGLAVSVIADPTGPDGGGLWIESMIWAFLTELMTVGHVILGVCWAFWVAAVVRKLSPDQSATIRWTGKWYLTWLVPGLNLVIPPLAVAECVRATRGHSESGPEEHRSKVLELWWVSWTIYSVLLLGIWAWLIVRGLGVPERQSPWAVLVLVRDFFLVVAGCSSNRLIKVVTRDIMARTSALRSPP